MSADERRPSGGQRSSKETVPQSPNGKQENGSQGSHHSTGSQHRKSSASSNMITHKCSKHIKLVEDWFGHFVDDAGKQHDIKRFTWTNHNCIQAQVITYGARIISLKLPSRKRIVDDVAVGFHDIAGYIYYGDLYVGATIGRVTDKIEKGTFALDHRQHWLSTNDGVHHSNGGFKGLDKVIWAPDVQGTKVMLSYVSHDLDEGYPGDLLVRVVFELTTKNEFIIDMSAVTTKTTIVNLSNLLYFNLAGHGAGPDELYKHIVSINANCYTPMMSNGLPGGQILNVIYTKNDFQIPKLLKNEMGIEPDDGFDEHLCVNRGIEQGLCFVARALHPPSGRVLEMYSNQCGVHFSTANHFGFNVVDLPVSIASTKKSIEDEPDSVFQLIDKLHALVAETLSIDSKTNYTELRELIRKLHKRKFSITDKGEDLETPVTPEEYLEENQPTPEEHPEIATLVLDPTQAKYLEGMVDIATKRETLTNYSELRDIILSILNIATSKTALEMHSKSVSVEEIKTESQLHAEQLQKEMEEAKAKEDAEMERKGTLRLENKIPSFYKDGRMHGKNKAIYKRHGAMCFQSENYPNAIYHENFPNCELRPGETYKHTIVYKFWIQSGDPNKWLRRNFTPTRK